MPGGQGEMSTLTRFIRGDFRDHLFCHGDGESGIKIWDLRYLAKPAQEWLAGRSTIVHSRCKLLRLMIPALY
jgi:hypothetical protein